MRQNDAEGGGVELNPMEKLAVAQAFYKRVAELVSTKSPDSLRSKADEHYVDMYDQTGAKSFDVKLLGHKVGTYSVVTTKPTESATRLEINVLDDEALRLWAVERDLFTVDEKMVRDYVADTGEVPYGCEVLEVEVPGDAGGAVKSTRLSVDPQAVADALGPMLSDASTALLLEGGE